VLAAFAGPPVRLWRAISQSHRIVPAFSGFADDREECVVK
jgi:hypothetical protein